MESLMNLPEVKEIEEVRSEFLSAALAINVIDQPSCTFANQMFLAADQKIKTIDEKLDPKRDIAYRAYKEWVKLIAELKEPYLKGKSYLNGQITQFTLEQKRIREEEIEKARQIALKAEMERRKEEEKRKLEEAAELEKNGLKEEAQAIIEEALEEIEKPIEVYIPPPPTPKVELKGMATVVTWHAEVFDIKKLCLGVGQGRYPTTFVDANMPNLNKQAISLRDQMRIDGVKAVFETKQRATGR